MVKRALLALVLLAAVEPARAVAAAGRVEATVEGLTVALELERRARVADVEELEAVTGQLQRAADAAASRRARLLQLARDMEPDASLLSDAEDAVVEAEARLRAAEDRRRMVSARLLERGRRIVYLGDEIARRRSGVRGVADPVTGRWDVQINPGGRKGTIRLSLDGTIVSGDYVLDGGFRGSVRGTYVADKLTLQRIDAERGFDANFYGRVNAAQKRIAGTWESTTIAPLDGPTGGTWSAAPAPERDETGGERP